MEAGARLGEADQTVDDVTSGARTAPSPREQVMIIMMMMMMTMMMTMMMMMRTGRDQLCGGTPHPDHHRRCDARPHPRHRDGLRPRVLQIQAETVSQ